VSQNLDKLFAKIISDPNRDRQALGLGRNGASKYFELLVLKR
jgi:hypothetical protein